MSKTNEEKAIEYVSRRYMNNITYDTYKNDYYYNNEKSVTKNSLIKGACYKKV